MLKLFAPPLLCLTFTAYTQMECSHTSAFRQQTSGLADERLENYDLKHVFLDMNADNTSTQISAKATLLLEIREETAVLVFELTNDLAISSITVNDVSATFSHTNALIEVELDQRHGAGTLLSCQISYSGEPNPESGFFSGINNAFSNAWGNQVTYTLSEPFNAKMWWPTKQDLTDKIDSVWVFVTTDDHLKVGSNGLLTNTEALSDNKIRYEWKSRYPIAYYLISMAIAEYVEYNNYAKPKAMNGDSILIQNYIYDNPETLLYYQDELDDIPEMIELFSNYYGLYPFYQEKYGHAMAPFGGGMEHQTMSSMGIFSFSLDAHELAHQWFGDLVTCATWQDIWINEGFAKFSEYLATEKILSQSNARALRVDDMLTVVGTGSGSVYVPAEAATDEDRIFNARLTYRKGGLIIHMIRRILNNDELFFQVLRTFLDQYRYSAATGEDFKNILETQTAMEFDAFFNQWYYGEGHPIFDITWQLKTDSIELNINQSTTSGVPLFTTPLEFVITYEHAAADTFRIAQSENVQQFMIPVTDEIRRLVFDPDRWLIKEVDRFVQIDDQGNALVVEDPNTLSIYPNPASNSLNFSIPVKKIRIIDATGKVVFASETQIDQVNVGELKTGLYLLIAETDQGSVKRKIVVK